MAMPEAKNSSVRVAALPPPTPSSTATTNSLCTQGIVGKQTRWVIRLDLSQTRLHTDKTAESHNNEEKFTLLTLTPPTGQRSRTVYQLTERTVLSLSYLCFPIFYLLYLEADIFKGTVNQKHNVIIFYMLS